MIVTVIVNHFLRANSRPALNSQCHKVYRKLTQATQGPLKQLSRKNSLSNGYRYGNTRQFFNLHKPLHFRPQYSKDKVPVNYSLVYENSQGPLLNISRVLSTVGGTSGAGMALWYLVDSWGQLQSWQLYALSGACLFCVTAVVSVNIIAKFFLTRIYMNESEGKFIGIYKSFFGRLSQINYSLEDVQPPMQEKVKPTHSKATVRVKDRHFHLRAADFIIPKYYNVHLKLT
ncbi:hypothetical protein ElyMa_004065100 [Elysia marginata]|uniref:Transmembrane protein 186 n=1 Tax=Elysia marginata TaxID=1093978 RepID=A0AAV4G7L0_9GAST|nr:hypothetical protein ElyMa_004065100 [Elysia marginata]